MNATFDLSNYPLEIYTGLKYFEPVINDNHLTIYRGDPRVSWYSNLKFELNSTEGKKWNEFYTKYWIDNEYQWNYNEELKTLLLETQSKTIDTITGLQAYLSYWKDCISIEFKCYNPITTIYHFEAMKEWFELNLENHIKKNEKHFLDDEIKEVEILNFKNDTLKEVETELLKQSTAIKNAKSITRIQAKELIKFYEYLNSYQFGKQNKHLDFDPNFEPMDLIKDKKIVAMWERKLGDFILKWNSDKDKQHCAAYCNYLLENKQITSISNAKKYAQSKFFCNIETTLDKIRKQDSVTKDKLKAKTDTIIRLIQNKIYGKL